jgi:diguanylate cyclase (GGDEF)-like protein
MRPKIMEYFSQRSKLFLITLGFLLVLLFGVMDYLTGTAISFGVFCLLPISLVTWFAGRWTGILISSVSAITWFIANLKVPYFHSFIYYWEGIVGLVFFLIFTYILSAFKNTVESEKKLARIDALTGVANVRFFYELAKNEISRASRYKHPFTVAYMDVDNFKVVNDRFGHSTGDSLLRSVAETIRKNIRESDVMARLGGDEFAILMPETRYESAQIVISRVRKSVLDVMRKNEWPITLSIGVVTYLNPPDSVDEIIKKADELMYSVKNKGKNSTRYEIFPELQDTEQVRDIKSQSFDI